MRLPFTRKTAPAPTPIEPAPSPDELTATLAHRHLLVTLDGTWAWYVLGEVDWLFKPAADREAILTQLTSRLADLTGSRITYRVTSAPFNRAQWVARLGRDFPEGVRLPDRPDSTTMADLVDAAQEHMLALGARSTAVVLGVRITTEKLDKDELRRVLSPDVQVGRFGDLEDTRRHLATVTGIIAKHGLDGAPISSKALGWLIHASIGMGLPVPPVLLNGRRDGWEEDEMAGFTAGVTVTARPYAGTTTVHATRNGAATTAHVVVLHVVKFEPRPDAGQLSPWMAWFQTLPYPVEVLASFDLIPPRELRKQAEQDRLLAENIIDHYREHRQTPPAHTQRAHQRAAEIEDEVTTGGRTAARARGVVMVAVTGDTEDDALYRANDLASLAAEQGMTLVQGSGQYASMRAFIPGEPVTRTGYITQPPLDFLAAGVPNASTRAGDGTGFLVGSVAGGHDVMLHDLWGGAARDRSNLEVTGGEPGAGKSSKGAILLDWSTRCGVQSIGFDPSDQWKRLCDLPHLRQDARHLDLFSARRGILTPSLLVVDPNRRDSLSGVEFRELVTQAEQERMDLTIDTFRELLPFGMVAGDTTGRIIGSIETAVGKVGGGYGVDPWEVVDELSRMGDVGREVAERLTTRAELRDGRLIFPARGHVDDEEQHAVLSSAVLTIITLKGLTLPPKDNPHRATWSRAQNSALAVLNLSSRLALRAMYADKARKSIQMDEMSIVTGGAGGSFAPFMTRASVDSRKWNTNVGLYFQSPRMLLDIDPEIDNLIGSAWIGRMAEKTAVAALDLLRVEKGIGFEKDIAALDQGEFMVRDWLGRVRKVRVDRDWWDLDTLAAIDTNPHGEGTYNGADLPGIFEDVTA